MRIDLSRGETNAVRSALSVWFSEHDADDQENVTWQELAAARRVAYKVNLGYVPGELPGEREATLRKG